MRPIDRAQRLLAVAVVVVIVVLVATGVWLSFTYQPSAAHAWAGLETASDASGVAWARLVHRLATALLLPLAVAFLAVVTVASQRWRAVTALLVLTLALGYTGFLLPWDQLALWAVTTGQDYRGLVRATFSDEVRFVIIGGVAVSQALLRTWFLVHVALGVALLATLTAAVRTAYRRGDPMPPSSPPAAGERWSNQSSTAVS